MVRRTNKIRGPTHGVSGYATTGKPGDFQFQYHNHGQVGQTDVAASRYGLQSHGSFREMKTGLFNPYFTRPDDIKPSTPVPNIGIGYMEPEISYEDQNAYLVASKVLSHQYQRLAKASHGTFLKNQIYEGFGQYDPAIQFMIRDKAINEEIEIYQPPSVRKHRVVTLTPPIRQNEMQLATANPTTEMKVTIQPKSFEDDHHQALSQIKVRPFDVSSQIMVGTHFSAGNPSATGHYQSPYPSKGDSPLSFIGSLQSKTSVPYAMEPIPPNPEVRPTGSTGILKDVTPELSVILPTPKKPVQTQL